MPDVTPTLEQIAASGRPTVAFLASEVIAVREYAEAQAGAQGARYGYVTERLDALESATREVRTLVIGLGIDTTEETERLDAHISALEEAGAVTQGDLGTILARQRGLFEAIRRYEGEVSAATGWSCFSAKAYEGEFLRWVDGLAATLEKAVDIGESYRVQAAESRAALAKYGRHKAGCPKGISEKPEMGGNWCCTCGLADALATTSEEREA